MTTKEVIEWLVEHHKELQYNEDGLITNLVRGYLDRLQSERGSVILDNIDFQNLKSLSIKQKQYKPYDKVETWMLGRQLKSKETGLLFVIDAIFVDECVRLRGNSPFWDLDNLYYRFTYEDGSPFGEEVV